MKNPRRLSRLAVLSALLAVTFAGTASAGGKLFTTDSDFDLGIQNGVNHSAPNGNQLQLDVQGTTFPVMWIANAGEDTVSKIDTKNNVELARYRTWFNGSTHGAWTGPAPSRTAVDSEGSCYVLNRHFDGRRPLLLKILVNGYVDRNGNGVMDTSTTSTPIPLVDKNSNGVLDPDELADERVAWAVPVGTAGSIGRALCFGTDGLLWVGLYNTGSYVKVDPTDGKVVGTPITGFSTPYGCLVDGGGKLWSVKYNNGLQELNTLDNSFVAPTSSVPATYNLALGGNGHIYMTHSSAGGYYDIDPSVTPRTVTRPAYDKGFHASTIGINVDGFDNIVVGNLYGGITKFKPDGTQILAAPYPLGSPETRGIVIDSENNVWQVMLGANRVAKYNGATGAYLGYVQTGNLPYTYSDAAGFALRNVTTKTGFWTVVLDTGKTGTRWGTIDWTGTVPAGGSLEVRARSGNDLAALDALAYQLLTDNVRFDMIGRYIQVQVKFTANAAGDSPVLFDLAVRPRCDVNADGAVNIDDINLIGGARGTTNPAYDIDRDGFVTVNDARQCVLACDKTNCAK